VIEPQPYKAAGAAQGAEEGAKATLIKPKPMHRQKELEPKDVTIAQASLDKARAKRAHGESECAPGSSPYPTAEEINLG